MASLEIAEEKEDRWKENEAFMHDLLNFESLFGRDFIRVRLVVCFDIKIMLARSSF